MVKSQYCFKDCVNMLLTFVFVALISSVQSTNLALEFKANNSTCSAACSTCDNKETQDTISQDIQQLINATQNNTQAINDIVVSLSRIRNTTTSNALAINDILVLVEQILQLQNNGSFFSPIPTSCQEIKNKQPNSPSGVYLLTPRGDDTNYAYCNMGELCGTGGGWTRLAYLDMSDSTVNCPTGFSLYQSGGVRACGRPDRSGGNCSSVQYPSNGISYSQICGRVVGYQYGSPDAVRFRPSNISNNINSYYVDGISITRGSPREHVWTLMAGVFELADNEGNCPCATNNGSQQHIPSFVGSHYFCESGAGNSFGSILYTEDPLWDGQGCPSQESNCCSVPGLPWFHRDYGNVTTTDYIELRVCGNQGTSDEDVPVSFYEIYVQ